MTRKISSNNDIAVKTMTLAMVRNDRVLDHFSISMQCFLKQDCSLHEEAICKKHWVLIEKSNLQ